MTEVAQIRNGEVVARYIEGPGRIVWQSGDMTMPIVAGAASPDGSERTLPIERVVDDQSTRPPHQTTISLLVEADRVVETVTITDAPKPPVTKASKARVRIWLRNNHPDLLTALTGIITAMSGDEQILWEDVSDIEIDRGGARQVWAAVVAQTETDVTIEDVIEGAAALDI